jgi:hypothetical protein
LLLLLFSSSNNNKNKNNGVACGPRKKSARQWRRQGWVARTRM